MSDAIKHECGIAMVRLLKPLEYYHQKYGDALWGLNKLYLLMEKQHNRGQEGAGMATVKLNACPGEEYIFRERAEGTGAIQEIFSTIGRAITDYRKVEPEAVPESLPFAGEMYMGHLRYSTTGRSGISYLHPFLRRNNWRSRNLSLAGNFNLTNVDEIMSYIVERGQHPRHNADTFIILEQLGYLLDDEVERLYRRFKEEGLNGQDINEAIENNIDIEHILREASALWDGGYVITGLTGSGDMFAFRDPQGIRPAFYYVSEEVIVVASERPVIQTVFDLKVEDVCELLPGQSIVVKRNGSWKLSQIHPALNVMPCSFERIYFSRGSDCDIYKERKELGRLLTEDILKQVGYDLDHTVFSFIPNTAEIAYYGMMQGLEAWLDRQKCEMICEQKDLLTCGQIREILAKQVRTEKLAIKDIKLRTFIAEGNSRNDLAAHVYDTTYGTVREGLDSIVVIDDSIVRGTTLRQSIIKILCRHRPRRIVIVSSSPQIRYPDCYGIDMSRMGEFIAFHAAVALLKERGMEKVIKEVYDKSKAQVGMPKEKVVNYVKEIYAPFTDEEISLKIAQMITPEDCPSEIRVIYQSIENLHKACPKHRGDWYFSGNYPTPGGNRLVNKAYVDWYELTGSH
jgi:amidophosphoribosyltransferase